MAAFTNPAGNIQGGFLAAMLDDTMGPALSATLGPNEFAPTLNLNVSFERPAVVGTIVGKGRIVKRGQRRLLPGGGVVPRRRAGRLGYRDRAHSFHRSRCAGPRSDYGPDYYGAYVRDLDGNKVHFVFRGPA